MWKRSKAVISLFALILVMSFTAGCTTRTDSFSSTEKDASVENDYNLKEHVEPNKEPECVHEWEEATLTAPRTCALCGQTDGEPVDLSLITPKSEIKYDNFYALTDRIIGISVDEGRILCGSFDLTGECINTVETALSQYGYGVSVCVSDEVSIGVCVCAEDKTVSLNLYDWNLECVYSENFKAVSRRGGYFYIKAASEAGIYEVYDAETLETFMTIDIAEK